MNQRQQHIVQWREHSIADMFEKCKLEIQQGASLHKTYFFSAVEPFIKKQKLMDGLCPYHMQNKGWIKELHRKRMAWHYLQKTNRECHCTCVFCRKDGCNHGKTPVEGKCDAQTCTRCQDEKCPLEWTSDKQTVWYTSAIEKRLGGGMHTVDHEHKGTRIKMMKKWKEEMASFLKHEQRTEWIKQQVLNIKQKLPWGHVLIKGDYIQNITH
jgi:hypothetical protein